MKHFWYSKHCNVIGETTDIKCGLLSKQLFQRTQQFGVTPNLWVTINLYTKYCLPFITWNKKHSLKQVVSVVYMIGKIFLAAVTLNCLWDVYFQTVKKNSRYLCMYKSSLHFSRRREDQINNNNFLYSWIKETKVWRNILLFIWRIFNTGWFCCWNVSLVSTTFRKTRKDFGTNEIKET